MSVASVPIPNPVPSSHPLRERNFRMLWSGQSVSLFGDQFYLVALPWVVLHLTGSAVAMGTVLMAAAIPRAVLMLIGGAVTDRVSPRRILTSTATARIFLVAAIGALIWFHLLKMWELYLLGFAFGVADAFAIPAFSAYLPSLVKREQLVAANSSFQTSAQVITIAAPTPAALVIKAFGQAWAFIIDAISFLFILGALWRLPDPPSVQTGVKRPSLWKSIGDGIASIRLDVPLRTLMLVAAMLNLCITGPMGVGLPYLAKIRFGSPTAYAALVSALAAGGLVGALMAGVVRVRRRGLLLLGVCVLISICLGPIGMLRHLWLIGAALFVMASGATLANVNIAAWIQQRVDHTIRGRVVSVLVLASIGIMPLSLAAAGFLVAWSVQWTFLLAGAAMLGVVGIGALQREVRDIE